MSRCIAWLIPVLVGWLLLIANPAMAYKVKDCGPLAEDGVRMAANFIRKNMSDIVDQYHYLSAKQRQEIVTKWPRLVIDCTDHHSYCRKGAGGWAHGGPGNQINICYLNKVDDGDTVCDLVGTIMHEVGHAHGFKSVQGHNNHTPYIREHDTMHRMSRDARTLCESIRPTNPVLPGKDRAGLGQSCKNNKDCKSGKCESRQCVCNDDSDCPNPLKPICHKQATKLNFCGVDNKAVGETCSKDGQCASNACQYGRCACKGNDDCPTKGIRTCHKRPFAWNFCGSTTKAVGERCSVNDQCRSGKCKKDKCVAN